MNVSKALWKNGGKTVWLKVIHKSSYIFVFNEVVLKFDNKFVPITDFTLYFNRFD